jgi:hypothetical protein
MCAMGEDHTLTQKAYRFHVLRAIHAAAIDDTLDFALALRQVDGSEQIPLQRDAVDGCKQVRRTGVGGVGSKNDANAALLPLVVVDKQPLEGCKSSFTPKATAGRCRDVGAGENR